MESLSSGSPACSLKVKYEPRESDAALKLRPYPLCTGTSLSSLLLWAHGPCPHILLLEIAFSPVPSGSPGQYRISSQPSFWGGP